MTFDYFIYKPTHLQCLSERDQKISDSNFNNLLELYTTLRHPVLPPFIGYCQHYKRKKSIFELKGKESLNSILFHSPLFDSTHKLITLYGISCAIEYLHSKNVILHYLSPEDVFLDSNYYPYLQYYLNKTLCLNHFEVCTDKAISNDEYVIFAPEFLNDPENFFNNPCVDVFAFSLIMLMTFTVCSPFDRKSKYQIYKFLCENNRPDIPDSVPENWRNLIVSCWDADSEKRPNFTKICDILESDDFVNDEINKDEFLKYKEIVKPFRSSL